MVKGIVITTAKVATHQYVFVLLSGFPLNFSFVSLFSSNPSLYRPQ